MSYFASVAMERLEEVPGDGDLTYFADIRFRPTSASVFCDYQERSDFFFYKDKFAYAVLAVEPDPTAMLTAKYAPVGSMTFHSGDRLDGQYDISLYRRGATNTRVYDVAYAQTDNPERRRFLIYIPSSTLYQLGAEVSEKVAAAKAEELKASQLLQQQTQQRVQ